MTDLLDSSQIRQIGVTIFSAILAFATPTEGFVLALVIAFGFNIFCGMRADGVVLYDARTFLHRSSRTQFWKCCFMCPLSM